jgi:transcriptional repressor NrdR
MATEQFLDALPEHDKAGLMCPFCYQRDSLVVDSRTNTAGTWSRRRRLCRVCRKRFTTYEGVIDPRIFGQQHARAKQIAAELREMARTLEVW